jgi:hypothetical protein
MTRFYVPLSVVELQPTSGLYPIWFELGVAEKAIDVARRGGDEAGAQQVEDRLKHYQTELRRAAEATSSGSTSQSREPARTP